MKLYAIKKANTWLGSLDACQKANVDAKKHWAFAYIANDDLIHEPITFYRTKKQAGQAWIELLNLDNYIEDKETTEYCNDNF